MREINWSDDALEDFDNAIGFIAKDNPAASILIAERINSALRTLSKRPIGRPGRHEGTYEKSVQNTSYIICYTLTEESVDLVRVIHSAQNWTEDEWP